MAMDALMLNEGWRCLIAWAPCFSRQIHQAASALGIKPTSPEDWVLLCLAASDALKRGHEATVSSKASDSPSGEMVKTVHGDVRLGNMMARQKQDGGFEVMFVDFGWAGVEGISR